MTHRNGKDTDSTQVAHPVSFRKEKRRVDRLHSATDGAAGFFVTNPLLTASVVAAPNSLEKAAANPGRGPPDGKAMHTVAIHHEAGWR